MPSGENIIAIDALPTDRIAVPSPRNAALALLIASVMLSMPLPVPVMPAKLVQDVAALLSDTVFSHSVSAWQESFDSSPPRTMRSSPRQSQTRWQIFFPLPQNPSFFCYNIFI
nr:MAG TPA: hypothetical protein [Caudoviricetes sp.]